MDSYRRAAIKLEEMSDKLQRNDYTDWLEIARRFSYAAHEWEEAIINAEPGSPEILFDDYFSFDGLD